MKSARFTPGKIFSPFSLLGRLVRVFTVLSFILLCSFLAQWFFTTVFSPPQPAPQQTDLQVILNFLLYFLSASLIFFNAFYAAVRYVDDIYEINDFRNSLYYFQWVVFGFKLPKAKVSGGKRNPSDRFDLLERIGGPGVLKIERDNVVVIETLSAYKDVLMAGEHNLTRFDSIKDILSTEEQYEKLEDIKALTADGIQVAVKEVQIRFRIEGFFPPNAKGLPTVAYLPSRQAVRELAYQRTVPADRKLALWTEAIKGKVSGIVRQRINNAYLGDLISPREAGEHPLEKLRKELESKETKEQFKKMGVCFNWCYIGEVYVPEVDVDRQHLQIWFAKKSGAINIVRAQSESESFASQERGRAEGQNMLLQTIVRTLQEIGGDGKDPAVVRKNLRNILLTRTAQILESRTSIYRTNHNHNGNHNGNQNDNDNHKDNHKENGEHDVKG
jgi:hypothetical protein